jgi:hypothetical protein
MSGPAIPRPSPDPTGPGQTCASSVDNSMANTPRFDFRELSSAGRDDSISTSMDPPSTTDISTQQSRESRHESAAAQKNPGRHEGKAASGGSGMSGRRNEDDNAMTLWDRPASELLLASSDHSDNEFDAEEFALPIALARAGLQSSRTYGISTGLRAQWTGIMQHPGSGSPNKVRRVEKLTRARSHRLCHKCNTEFGLQELCKTCGHTRCKECKKRPSSSRPIEVVTDSTRVVSQQYFDVPSDEAIKNSVRAVQSSPDLAQSARPTLSLAELQPTITSKSISHAESSRNTQSWLQNLSPPPELNPLPRYSSVRMTTALSKISNPESTFLLNHDEDHIAAPQTPKHYRKFSCASNDLQPMSPTGSVTPSSFSLASARAGDSNASHVENPRVFRRARHQVRFICEQCRTVFPTRHEMHCQQCGHARCNECVRDP